jgi:hypothetical protein
MEQHPNTKTGFTGRLLPENSLLATFVLNFQLISPLELGNLAEALGHLALGSHMVWPILLITIFINRPLWVTYEIHCIRGCSAFPHLLNLMRTCKCFKAETNN